MAFKERALELVNQARAAQGVPPVQVSGLLEFVAQDGQFSGCAGGLVVRGRCADMGARNYFSHAIRDCSNKSIFDMLNAAGITHSGAAENIGFMNATDDELVAAENIHNQFMNDPKDRDHRANLLNPNFTHVGIGLFRSFNNPWSGAPPPVPPHQPLTRVFVTSQVFARSPSGPPGTMGVGGAFHAVTPARILDTRIPIGVPTRAPLGAGVTLNVQVTGAGGLPPAGASAVVLNVTVTNPSTRSFLTVFPAGEPQPVASNLNFTGGLTVANLVVVKLGANGQVSVRHAAGSTHVIIDVAGWFDGGGDASGSHFHPLTPSRILDSRTGLNASSPIGAGATLDLGVLNRGGVPPTGVSAVVVNVTAADPTATGFFTVFPTGEPRPQASNLNFAPGETTPNLVVGKLGGGGSISFFNFQGQAHVIADVAGWFDQGNVQSGSRYHPVSPARVLDTRLGTGAPVGPLGPGATLNLQVGGVGGVPALGVAAVAMNVTVVDATAQSFLTVFPAGESMPNASNLCYVAGQTVPNMVIAKVTPGGRLSLFNHAGSAHVIADVAGWFDAG